MDALELWSCQIFGRTVQRKLLTPARSEASQTLPKADAPEKGDWATVPDKFTIILSCGMWNCIWLFDCIVSFDILWPHFAISGTLLAWSLALNCACFNFISIQWLSSRPFDEIVPGHGPLQDQHFVELALCHPLPWRHRKGQGGHIDR